SSDLTSVSAGKPEPIAESPNPPENERQAASLSESGQYNAENASQPDGPKIPTPGPESSNEPADSEFSFRELIVTSKDKKVAMAYDSDPYALLPPWLVGNAFEMQQSSQAVPVNEGDSVAQDQAKATGEPVTATDETS